MIIILCILKLDSLYKSNHAKNGIFVITINNALLFVRVEKSDNYIELMSDNKGYSSEKIYLDDVNDF